MNKRSIALDIGSIKYWAEWYTDTIPKYRVFEYQGYVKDRGLYIYQEYRGKAKKLLTLEQLVAQYGRGNFKPFVLSTQEPPKGAA